MGIQPKRSTSDGVYTTMFSDSDRCEGTGQPRSGVLPCPAHANGLLQVLFHWAGVNCLAAVIFHKIVELTLHELYTVYKMII